MPSDYVPATFSGGSVSATALSAEFAKLKVSLDACLQRVSSTGNAMDVDLDLNANRILNVAKGVDPADVATIQNIVDAVGSINQLQQISALVATQGGRIALLEAFDTGAEAAILALQAADTNLTARDNALQAELDGTQFLIQSQVQPDIVALQNQVNNLSVTSGSYESIEMTVQRGGPALLEANDSTTNVASRESVLLAEVGDFVTIRWTSGSQSGIATGSQLRVREADNVAAQVFDLQRPDGTPLQAGDIEFGDSVRLYKVDATTFRAQLLVSWEARIDNLETSTQMAETGIAVLEQSIIDLETNSREIRSEWNATDGVLQPVASVGEGTSRSATDTDIGDQINILWDQNDSPTFPTLNSLQRQFRVVVGGVTYEWDLFDANSDPLNDSDFRPGDSVMFYVARQPVPGGMAGQMRAVRQPSLTANLATKTAQIASLTAVQAQIVTDNGNQSSRITQNEQDIDALEASAAGTNILLAQVISDVSDNRVVIDANTAAISAVAANDVIRFSTQGTPAVGAVLFRVLVEADYDIDSAAIAAPSSVTSAVDIDIVVNGAVRNTITIANGTAIGSATGGQVAFLERNDRLELVVSAGQGFSDLYGYLQLGVNSDPNNSNNN